jgi:hypothetical protein
MTGEDPVVWVVTPEGQFVQQDVCGECNACDEDEDEMGIAMLFEDDPDAICPCCSEPIKPGDMTVPLTHWDRVYADQTEEYPLYGRECLVHIDCIARGRGDGK